MKAPSVTAVRTVLGIAALVTLLVSVFACIWTSSGRVSTKWGMTALAALVVTWMVANTEASDCTGTDAKEKRT